MTDPLRPAYRLTISGLPRMERGDFGDPDHVVSILDPGWDAPGPLAGRGRDELTELRFHDRVEPGPGWRLPSRDDVATLIRLGERLAGNGCRHLHVHCHMGVSRSTAAAAIVRVAAAPGREREVFEEISAIRPKNWPNSLMVGLADELLGLGGGMVRELGLHHRRVAAADPELARLIVLHGRGHEVPRP